MSCDNASYPNIAYDVTSKRIDNAQKKYSSFHYLVCFNLYNSIVNVTTKRN